MARRSRVSLISRDNGEMLIYCTSKRAVRLARTSMHERKYALRPRMAPVPPMKTSINSPCGENLAKWTQIEFRFGWPLLELAVFSVHVLFVRFELGLVLENMSQLICASWCERHSYIILCLITFNCFHWNKIKMSSCASWYMPFSNYIFAAWQCST